MRYIFAPSCTLIHIVDFVDKEIREDLMNTVFDNGRTKPTSVYCNKYLSDINTILCTSTVRAKQ